VNAFSPLPTSKSLFTVGHSTRSLDELIRILHASNVSILADVRSYPKSRTNPQFTSDAIADVLPQHGVEYVWLQKLGGRREGLGRKSKNTCWKNQSFRNYADYMETQPFLEGFADLAGLIRKGTVAIMCAEALYWRCHRSMISDFAKSRGFRVVHLIGDNQWSEHKYSECARIVNGALTYRVNSEISDFVTR
jgi:uncharacterized protein (DUF488 family)